MLDSEKDALLKNLLNENAHLQDRYIADKEGIGLDFLIFAGLAGFCSFTLVQMISLSSLDTSLTVAMYAFAVALPILLMKTLNLAEIRINKYEVRQPVFITMLEVIGIIATATGAICVFWHFSPLAGVLVIVVGAVSLFANIRYSNLIFKANKKG